MRGGRRAANGRRRCRAGGRWARRRSRLMPLRHTAGALRRLAVHPSNPDIVYAGAAQGGLYRSLNAGAGWTPLLDNELTLSIGSVAISPSNPTTVFVGTGETAFSLDSFFGVGIYRITNADTNPVISGPLNKTAGGVDIFSGLRHKRNYRPSNRSEHIVCYVGTGNCRHRRGNDRVFAAKRGSLPNDQRFVRKPGVHAIDDPGNAWNEPFDLGRSIRPGKSKPPLGSGRRQRRRRRRVSLNKRVVRHPDIYANPCDRRRYDAWTAGIGPEQHRRYRDGLCRFGH